ncbi:Response regulators consisting of a CheY-like receiver domain and a winged-helix DNA-binding domain [Cupriavidus gilardii J11]|uniref:Response regulators consisting of a CheY-like receiver domain and a winged-helix DNA-binding domain n=1 Tax=Cupriavidus gilardii J11 TaxID=936133 RepID=A0A562B2T7_9BURK|nr:Response regulators consisting of a CheY-like receiver domain and a winged-helix DNA-binding domain [Cupriavidus gilardii J11]
MQPDKQSIDWTSVANQVRDLMLRHGVGKRAQAAALSKLLGISFSAASRKMKGQLPWTLSQLKEVADHYGEPSPVLLDSMPHASAPHTATLIVGARRYTCQAWIGEAVSPHQAGRRSASRDQASPEFVALEHAGGWSVYDIADAPMGRRFVVDKVVLHSHCSEADRLVVAVVDDARAVTDSVCEYLTDMGCEALPYYDRSEFLRALDQIEFDAFILDWSLGADTAAEAIARIRASDNPNAPIILLTGRGRESESDIAQMVDRFGVLYAEKPVKLAILLAQLMQACQRA